MGTEGPGCNAGRKKRRTRYEAPVIWLWFAGRDLDEEGGKGRTNATWLEDATRVFHPTGHAGRWSRMRHWKRSAIRQSAILGSVLIGWDAYFHPAVTVTALSLLAVIYGDHLLGLSLLTAIYGGQRGHRGVRKFFPLRHYWQYVRPLSLTLRAELGIVPTRLQIEPDHSKVVIGLPEEYLGSDHERAAVTKAIQEKVGIEEPEATWNLHGRNHEATFIYVPPPPGHLWWDEIEQHILDASYDELVCGMGRKGQVVKVSVKSDSPMFGIAMGTGGGKALALDTPVPTPGGWTTMGAIKAGDVVFDEAGAPCTVTGAWPVRYDRPCYEVEFSDGTVIVADAEHQWLTESLAFRRTVRLDRPAPLRPRSGPRIVTTADMAATLHHGKHANHSVRVAAALQCPEADLPVPPYTLGAWLGDGATATGSITSADAEIVGEIEAEGETAWVVPSTIKAHHASYRVRGLNVRLRAAGVLGNKHIPDVYLRASEAQRRSLLGGLLDTDGYCSVSGRVEFCSTRERLARDVLHLVATLGYKPAIRSKTARLYGKDCGTVWTVTFTTADKVFRLPRKLSRQVTGTRKTVGRRYVTAVRPVPSVPVRCITVDSPGCLYLIGKTCIPTHNTNLLAFWMAQRLRLGDMGYMIDGKRFSHPYLFKDMQARRDQLPNIGYVRRIDDIHRGLVRLGRELAERNERAENVINAKGQMLGFVGHRLWVGLEELNLVVPLLKIYWVHERERLLALAKEGLCEKPPKQSPALVALSQLAFAGRQVGIHLIFVGQRLDADVLGATGSQGGAVRGNIGVRALARYDEPAWKMQAGGTPMPPPPSVTGRIQLWVGGQVAETQVPEMDYEQVRGLAVSGKVTPVPQDWPGVAGSDRLALPPVPVLHPGTVIPPGQDPIVLVPRTRPPGMRTLREAMDEGIFNGADIEAIRQRVKRAKKKGRIPREERIYADDGKSELFGPEELVEVAR